MSKTKIGELSFDVGLNVDWRTAEVCLRLLEVYLNNHPAEKLAIADDTAGDWYIEIGSREMGSKPYKEGEKE